LCMAQYFATTQDAAFWKKYGELVRKM